MALAGSSTAVTLPPSFWSASAKRLSSLPSGRITMPVSGTPDAAIAVASRTSAVA